ncbi:nmrA-like family domain-containing 1 [Brachionus plicatilis]|uniref:NmrA-like family domain-containing protein 1 n=1 Tax=Brachionus plicatilis TaxID=10195 RepID=A0A3M7SX54_BRAPC|nr:nmrA-like family domain-containing 1 [Brachionus plicatilis]
MSKIISVFGATGSQGGSVVKALAKNGMYSVKAITRNPKSDKAQTLSKLNNVTVHQADLDDPASIDKVLEGCYGSFLVTDFAAHFDNRETKQGISFVDSAIKNKLSHIVFSGLEHVEPIINKPCLHFDYKAKIEDYGLSHKDKITFTSIRLPMYNQMIPLMFKHKLEDNQFSLTLPMGDNEVFLMNVEDAGKCVKSIFDNPDKYGNSIIPVAGDKLKGKEIEKIINKYVAPVKFLYANTSLEKFRSFGFPGVEDIVNMFEYYQTGKMHRDLNLTKELYKDVESFDQWVAKNLHLFK